MAASLNGHAPAIDLLLRAGADPNVVNYKGYTALMAAARHGDTNCVDLILRSHPDIEMTNIHGDSALVLARDRDSTDQEKPEIVKMLITAVLEE